MSKNLVAWSRPALTSAFLLLGVGAAAINPARTDPSSISARLDRAQMESFIVSARDALPNHATGPLQTAQDPVVWRRHDWAGQGDAADRPEGYQASDSVEQDLSEGRIYPQTFDFGDAGRQFQRFDLGVGDGGQALVILNGAVYGSMTEDGGAGVQWFVGEGCRRFANVPAALQGWLFFDGDARAGWRDKLARLKSEHRLSCPWFYYNNAYTRWRRLEAHFPYRISTSRSDVQEGTWTVDAILSEHYGGSSIATAAHLERFWFGRGYGMLRWERWENAASSSRPQLREGAQALADSRRCGPVEGSDRPGLDWEMVDCRTWTNFIRLTRPWKVADFEWPRADVLDQFEGAFGGR